MRKKSYGLFLMLLLLVFIPIKAQAETSYGSDDWSVVFTADSKMDCNFSTSDMDDVIYGMQPGDNAILTIHLKNENKKATDWYMLNKVLYSLEDRSPNKGTRGGAYTYILTYTNASGVPKTLFDSETVGGDDVSQAGQGLHEATDALEEFFFLDTLAGGEKSKITLEIALDGETNGNDYQNTLADLQMRFATELSTRTATVSEHAVRRVTADVRTGDDFNLTPFIGAACVSGTLLLFLALFGAIDRKKQKKEAK